MNESPVDSDQTREESDNPDIVDALRAHYRDEDPAGSAGLVALGSPPQRRWWVGLGVAAAIILVAALVIPRFFDDRSTIAEPPPADTWVWIGHNGVQVEVPASWQFDTSHPCQPWFSPDAPHVRLGTDTGFNLAIGCTEGISDPPVDQPPVVDFMHIDDGAPMPPIADRFPSKRVPGFVVRVRWGQDYEEAHPQIGIVARRIVESATAIAAIDNNGCPNIPATTLSPDLDGLPEPDLVAICQYRAEDSTLRLWSSRRLLDGPAHELGRNLRALGTAPIGHGGQCNDDPRAMQVTLHVRAGTDERIVRVNYQSCSNTGIVTARGNPGMTPALCQQIFVMPTSSTEMAEPLAQRCGFPIPTAQPT